MDIRTVAILGSGTMGQGIAQVFVNYGFTTNLFDVNPIQLQSAKKYISNGLQIMVDKDKISADKRNESILRLNLVSDFDEALKDADLVIECIPEDLELKKDLVKRVHASNKGVIFASNTSSISISTLATASSNPSNVIGMHFFNPVPVMGLIEIIIGDQTSESVLKTVVSISNKIGKEPIVVRDFPGFASSRLGVVLGLEAIRMVEQGVASPEDIDKAMKLGYRHPMGPLELTDLIGLDVRLKIAEYLQAMAISPAFEIPDLLRNMVAQGKLGRKTGEGFYKW